MSGDSAVLSWPGTIDMSQLLIPTTLLQEALEHSITGKEEGLRNLTCQLTKLEAARTDEQAMLCSSAVSESSPQLSSWSFQLASAGVHCMACVVNCFSCLQGKHEEEIAKLNQQMLSRQEAWAAEKAKLDSIASEADRKHQQLADRTALVRNGLGSGAPLSTCSISGERHANKGVLPLQELEKLQASAKQDVAAAQAQVVATHILHQQHIMHVT